MYFKKLTSTPQIHPSLAPKNDFLERASEGKP